MTITKERFLLIDVLKIMTLLAIAILHVNEFVFYQDIFPLGKSSPIWHTFSFYARIFTLGGQILVASIYLLFGYAGKSKKSLLLISLFALLGQIVLALVFQEFEWDIYAYLAVSNLLIVTIPFFYKANPLVPGLSFIMLCLPPDLFQNLTSENPFWTILTGKMSDYNSGSWPLLPWFFLALGFYQTGLLIRSGKIRLQNFYPFEKILWPLLFLMSLPFFGHYYWVPIGRHFYQFVFNQLPHIYWFNFLVFVFWMRLAFLASVQLKLKDSKIVRWISNLYWIRHLGLVYLLSIIYLGIGMQFTTTFQQNPWLFDLFFTGIMPISELAGRFFVSIVKSRRHE